ncbi:MAG: mercury(II) reductase [Proteobacteria bacterium]|nr:mercury(II) reductase [Pseudomonadota bacterium]
MSAAGQDCCTGSGAGHGGTFDLAVIGAGSAGFSAAITAADQGAQVALIGHGTIGGTCVNVGCVPSKALIRAVEAIHQANAAPRFAGIAGNARLTDWAALSAQKDQLVASLRQAKYIDLLPAYNGIAYLEGKARLGNGGVMVDGQHIDAAKVIISTGGHEYVPPIPGIEDVPYLTSTSAFELASLPATMIVIGGGYIGCELAQMFARAGVGVTILFRSRLLPAAEPEISAALAGYFQEEGIAVRQVGGYESIRGDDRGMALSVTIDGASETLEARQVLLSVGRKANTVGLGLEEAGVALSANGGIEVDDRMRTTKAGIYAAGDVTGGDQFVYMAAYGAKIAAENALNGDGRRYDAAAMPAVVFTDPQVASVGLTEAKARAQGLDVRTAVLPLEYVPRALVARDTRGLIKLVADKNTGRLLGAHILAPEGADSIQTAALAIKHGMTVRDLAETIFPYLTTVEGLKLAALSFDQDVTMLSCCAG